MLYHGGVEFLNRVQEFIWPLFRGVFTFFTSKVSLFLMIRINKLWGSEPRQNHLMKIWKAKNQMEDVDNNNWEISALWWGLFTTQKATKRRKNVGWLKKTSPIVSVLARVSGVRSFFPFNFFWTIPSAQQSWNWMGRNPGGPAFLQQKSWCSSSRELAKMV